MTTTARAYRMAEAVADAWNHHHANGEDLHVPTGVVAALALVDHRALSPTQLTAALHELSPGALAGALRDIWRLFITQRPDLVIPAMPLIEWITSPRHREQLAAAHAAAQAALRAGILTFTADRERRHTTDLLGAQLDSLRSSRTKADRGQHYTSPEVARVLAAITGLDHRAQPGDTIAEHTIGTGALFCAAARTLRDHDRNPAAYHWHGTDTDRLALACCAINAHLWELGTHVYLNCADTLDPSTPDQAHRNRLDGIIALDVARLEILQHPTS
jgi:methylase of polypeptide subunit release factors